MPSASGKQHRFMEMVAHNAAAAKRVGVPQSVGEDFIQADKAADKKFPGKSKPKRQKRSDGLRKYAQGLHKRLR